MTRSSKTSFYKKLPSSHSLQLNSHRILNLSLISRQALFSIVLTVFLPMTALAQGSASVESNSPVAVEIANNGLNGNSAPTLSIDDVSANEEAGTITFTVRLSEVSEQDVSVDFTTTNGTAVAPDDFIATSGTLTIPAGSVSSTITFGNIGDFGDAGSDEENVANMLLALNPDFITTNGDNNYPDGEESTWEENVLQYYGDYVDANDVNVNRFYGSLGNHDYHVFPSAFLNGLALPEGQGNERYYDFVKGPVHFFAIDSNPEQPDGRDSESIQAQWLQSRLAASTSVWKIVYMHHAPWSSSSKHGNNRTMQWPYDAWGADAVFAGHDHIYERISKDEDGDGNPILYFVNGLGGRSPYDIGSPIEGSEVRYNGDVGAMFMRANDESITYEFHSVSGGLIDQFVVNSSGLPSSSLTIATTIIDDNVVESAETFTVDLSNPINATLSDDQGVGTITDNDGVRPVTVSFQDGLNGYSGTRDTKLLTESPGSNYGESTELELDGSPAQAGLVYWDLTSIPEGSVVQSVDITLEITNKSDDSYEFYELKRPWLEGEATWMESGSGQSWQVAGADGLEDRGTSAVGAIIDLSKGLRTILLNDTGVAVVQAWVNNPAINHGFIIQDYINASDGLDFSSREDDTVSNRPKLTVTYLGEPTSTDTTTEFPYVFHLEQNYPNPFNPTTRISYSIAKSGFVTLQIYDMLGREIQTLVNEFQQIGTHALNFDARGLSGGTYFYKLQVGDDFVEAKKMLFLK